MSTPGKLHPSKASATEAGGGWYLGENYCVYRVCPHNNKNKFPINKCGLRKNRYQKCGDQQNEKEQL